MPEFRIENLIERARFERVRRGETNHVTMKITRHIFSVADFGQSARGKRFISFFAWVRRQTHELAVRQAINRRASFSVNRIRPEIHVADPVIQQLRRRNQRIIRGDSLHTVFRIEICAHDDFVVVTIKRGVKFRITIVSRIKQQVKHDQARARPKQPIEQNRPDFPGPRPRSRGHQFERSIAGDLFRRQRWQLQCALIESQKNEISRRGRFSPFLPKQIFEALFAAPRRRKKRRHRKEMPEKNQAGPKNTNHPQDQQPMTTKPVHVRPNVALKR